MVNRGHEQAFANRSRLKSATDMGMVSLYLSCQDASTDMQHDLFTSACDLDLRLNIELDLSKSPCICFDAPCRKEHDGARVMPLAFLVRKLFAKTFCPKQLFLLFLTPAA